MKRLRMCTGLAVAAALPLLAIVAAEPAAAGTPIGTCTNSYTLYDEPTLVAIDPSAADIFTVIDTNHDLLVCFKPYPNGDHNGHFGNLVDDKAAPHA